MPTTNSEGTTMNSELRKAFKEENKRFKAIIKAQRKAKRLSAKADRQMKAVSRL